MVKYISESDAKGQADRINVLIKNTLVWFILLSSIFSLIVIIFSNYLSDVLFSSQEYSILIIIIAIAFPFAALNSVFDAVLRGLKKFNYYAKISIWFSFISVIISIIFAYYWKITGVVLAISIFAVITGITYVLFFLKTKFIDLRTIFKTPYKNSPEFKNIFKIGFVSLIAGFIGQFALLAIRTVIIDRFSFEGSGLFQCMYSISTNLFSFFFTALGVYSLPVLSELKGFEENLYEINNTFRFTLYFIIPVVCIAFVFKDLLLLLLFSKNFESASQLFFFYLLGDFFKALAWVAGIWFIPNLKLKVWLILEIINNSIYLIVFYFLLTFTDLNLKSVSIAYFASNVVHLILSYSYFKKYSGFYFLKKNLIFLFSSFAVLILVFLLANYYTGYMQVVLIPILLIWLFFSTTKIERNKVVELIKKKIN